MRSNDIKNLWLEIIRTPKTSGGHYAQERVYVCPTATPVFENVCFLSLARAASTFSISSATKQQEAGKIYGEAHPKEHVTQSPQALGNARGKAAISVEIEAEEPEMAEAIRVGVPGLRHICYGRRAHDR